MTLVSSLVAAFMAINMLSVTCELHFESASPAQPLALDSHTDLQAGEAQEEACGDHAQPLLGVLLLRRLLAQTDRFTNLVADLAIAAGHELSVLRDRFARPAPALPISPPASSIVLRI
jgi:hypothetical protein